MEKEYYEYIIATQFTNELNFANPEGYSSLVNNETPNVSVDVNIEALPLDGGYYESKLNVKFTASKKKTELENWEPEDVLVFVGYISYSAIAKIPYYESREEETLSEEQKEEDERKLRLTLMVELPKLIFPFVRCQVANVTRDAGFAPLLINPIDFDQMYANNNT